MACYPQSEAHNTFAARRINGQKPTQHHATRAAEHVKRQAQRHQRHRHAVQLARRLGGKDLHHAKHYRMPKEKCKTPPHGGNSQKIQISGGAAGAIVFG